MKTVKPGTSQSLQHPCLAQPPSRFFRADSKHRMVAGVAAQERPIVRNEGSHQDLSGSQEAIAVAYPVCTPDNLPAHVGEQETQLQGTLPEWLTGSIIRNGPGAFAPQMKHSFDGFARLVKFTFKKGKVFVNKRFLDSNTLRSFKKTGKLESIEFGTAQPFGTILWRVFTSFLQGKKPDFTDNASVNTWTLKGGKELVAVTEPISGMLRIDIESLTTIGRYEFKDELDYDLSSAHPVIYPDGTMYNMFFKFGGSRIVAKVNPDTQTRTEIASVPVDNKNMPPWIHDIPGTENYIIIPDTPVMEDLGLKTLYTGGSDYANNKWCPGEYKTKFHLVPKFGGPVRTIECPFDFMAYHYANAFESEDGQTVYVDAPVYEDATSINELFLDSLFHSKSFSKSTLKRITLPLDGSTPTIQSLVPNEEYHNTDLPRVNPNYKFRDYQFVYGTSMRQPAHLYNAVSKLDVKQGTSKQWYEANCIATEPLMLPRPGATEEDDGVVTSMVVGGNGKGFLLVLDAKSFTEIARASVPDGLPYGFHNQFYPATA